MAATAAKEEELLKMEEEEEEAEREGSRAWGRGGRDPLRLSSLLLCVPSHACDEDDAEEYRRCC